jgi:hypothetical protein
MGHVGLQGRVGNKGIQDHEVPQGSRGYRVHRVSEVLLAKQASKVFKD